MLFKKEFDIDKDFFIEKQKKPTKSKIAIKVFFTMLFLTLGFLFYVALNSNTDERPFLSSGKANNIKEARRYYLEGVTFFEEGKYKEAIESLNKQLALVDDPDAYNYLGKIYAEKGDTESAIENYKKALELKEDFYEPLFELGKIYYSLNNFKEAAKYLSKACFQNTENLELMGLTAEAYKQIGKVEDAIFLFKKILSLEPHNSYANTKMGEIYYQKRDFKAAIGYFEDAIFLAYDESIALELAKSYFELNNFVSALDVIEEILQTNKDNKQALALKKAIEYKKANIISEEKKETPSGEIKTQETPMNKEVLTKYIEGVEFKIKTNWAPPIGSNLKKASVKFTIDKNGNLISNAIYVSSGMREFDTSAKEAIELSAPFKPLPKELNREYLDVIFTFDFNIK